MAIFQGKQTTDGIKRVKKLQNSKERGRGTRVGPAGQTEVLQKPNQRFSTRASQGF